MIKTRPYKTRTHDFLLKRLRIALNRLQMRDWEVTLFTGIAVPEGFEAFVKNAGGTLTESEVLSAKIWINMAQCKAQNYDPLETLYHEISHIWLDYIDDTERQCNIIANLMMD